MNTIDEAKSYLRDNFDEGAECPVCRQRVQRYHRQITSSMAFGLLTIYIYFLKHPEKRFVHVPTLAHDQQVPLAIFGGDFAKLRFWGLIESKSGDRDDGSWRNGWWGITEKGYQFIQHKILVPKGLAIFNQKPLGLEGDYISIKDALGNKFNYDQLMVGLNYQIERPTNSIDKPEQVNLF